MMEWFRENKTDLKAAKEALRVYRATPGFEDKVKELEKRIAQIEDHLLKQKKVKGKK